MGQSLLSSVRGNTYRLRIYFIMNTKLLFVLLVGGQCVLGARQLRGQAGRRDGKSLVGTFPFNTNVDDHHHGHHEEHDHDQRTASQSLGGRAQRQGGDDTDVSFGAVAAAGPGSYDKRCHTTYVTNYESRQEEECEENYRKSCFIEYEKIAFNETVEICRTPLVKDCDVQGPEICRTEYESECWTKQEV